jgi:hypothetical protein
VVHRVDDRAGAEEQHRLEEGVGEEVEHRRRVDADARGHEHVAELRAGRIGDHALDVVLHEADGRREEGRGGADD